MNKRKLMKSMKGINKEIEKMRVEFSKNSALEEAKKTGVINYTEILRDMTVMRSLNVISDELFIATEMVVKSSEEIETECKKEGKTPQEIVINDFIKERRIWE